MINLIVAGAGEGTYKNLYPITKLKDPDLGMKIAVVLDVLPVESLHHKMQRIIQAEGVIYRQVKELPEKKCFNLANTVGVIMTPNQWHLKYTSFFVSQGMPVYVEKPAVTSLSDLEVFLKLAATYPQLVYAAEYCVDGKALGVLAGFEAVASDDERLKYLSIMNVRNQEKLTTAEFSVFLKEFGRLKAVHGTLLEGEGTAGVADHRQWLLDGIHGGMIRDLSSHLFGVLYDCGLATAETIGMKVVLGRYDAGMSIGTWRKLRSPAEGETYASIQGRFLTPYGMPDFKFEVGKYWPKHDRELVLEFEKGQAQLSYEKPFSFLVDSNNGAVEASVTAEFYPTLSLLNFKKFLQGNGHGHIGRAAAIVRFNETARAIGLTT